MNTLVYTCNDLSKNSPSLGCLELLYQSLLTKNNTTEFDFLVLTNNKNAEQISHKVVYDHEFGEVFPGYLKFSPRLPSGYDRYLYLDSDILFYEKIENVMPTCSPICAMIEPLLIGDTESDCRMIDSEWHRYCRITDKDIETHQNKPCINSGQFSFKAESHLLGGVRSYLHESRYLSLYSRHQMHSHAQNEQSSFNRYLLDVWSDVDLSKLTNLVTTHPERDKEKNKTVFHFTGFSSGGMQLKLSRMTAFASEYSSRILE
jgi:hypothetical protein